MNTNQKSAPVYPAVTGLSKNVRLPRLYVAEDTAQAALFNTHEGLFCGRCFGLLRCRGGGGVSISAVKRLGEGDSLRGHGARHGAISSHHSACAIVVPSGWKSAGRSMPND